MKNKKNKKAFTLIELLAVIVVLALILLIAVPRVLKTISDSEKETFRITGENLVKVARDNIVLDSENNVLPKTYTIEDGAFVGDSVPMSGELPDSGTIVVREDGSVSLTAKNDKYCIRKYYTNDEVTIDTNIENCTILESPDSSCFTTNNISDTEIEITGYDSNCPKNVVIPNKINGKTVVRVGAAAFYNKQLTSVYIPDSVTNIGDYAFLNNQLTSITIPDSVTSIGYSAFSNNQLTNVFILNGVTNIGDFAFYNNQLTNVTIPDSVTSIGAAAFNRNQLPDNKAFIYKRNADGSEDKTTLIGYGGAKRDNVVIPTNVTSIGYAAFLFNQLTSVFIPNSVTVIGDHAFQNNQITSVTISDSVTSIGYAAFDNNKITSITIPTSVTSIEAYAFFNNQFTNIVIPTSVTSMGYGAFNRNQLPDSEAFIYKRNSDGSEDKTTLVSYGGAKRNNVVIPNNVTNIGNQAFYGNQLTSITIPDSVTSIEAYAFLGNQFTNITIPDSVTSIGNAAFNNNQLPDSEAFIYGRDSNGNETTTIVSYGGAKRDNVVIPTGVTSIGYHAFYYNQLTSITIPDSVTSISGNAFLFNQLTNITIPSNVTIQTSSISQTFYTAYVTNNLRLGGIYTAASQTGTWTKQ